MSAPATTLSCEMKKDCAGVVAYIDDSGFIYCAPHGISRRNHRPCRKLRPHELRRLEAGQPVTRY